MVEFSDIKGFTFDLDGVITDTAKFHEAAWHDLADDLGIEWSAEIGNHLKGISRMASLDMILATDPQGKQYSQEEKQQLADKKNAHYRTLIATVTPDDILPGIKSFLDDMLDKGYTASVASASKNAPSILEKLELTSYFVGIVDPATLTHGKPDPEIFVKAGELLNLQPSQIIGLEDAGAGVEAIKGAGQTALGIGPAAKTANPELWFDKTENLTLNNIKKQLSV